MSYLRYLSLFTHDGVSFILFVFVLCLVHPRLTVYLDCSFVHFCVL
jgi:hypothetical protein